jgi:hypothetical protein
MAALRAGVLYFAVVFAAGSVLGTIRVLWIAPRVGVRIAELPETPVLVAISAVAVRWIVRWLDVLPRWPDRLTTGAVALGLLLPACSRSWPGSADSRSRGTWRRWTLLPAPGTTSHSGSLVSCRCWLDAASPARRRAEDHYRSSSAAGGPGRPGDTNHRPPRDAGRKAHGSSNLPPSAILVPVRRPFARRAFPGGPRDATQYRGPGLSGPQSVVLSP